MKSKLTFSKSDHRKQYEYARTRLRKKKRLMRHLVLFIAGSILFLIMDLLLKFGKDSFPLNWSAYLILFWFFLLLVHALNFLLINRFMDKEWEDRQIEKLKAKQIERILKLQKEVEKKYIVSDEITEEKPSIEKTTTEDSADSNPNQIQP